MWLNPRSKLISTGVTCYVYTNKAALIQTIVRCLKSNGMYTYLTVGLNCLVEIDKIRFLLSLYGESFN